MAPIIRPTELPDGFVATSEPPAVAAHAEASVFVASGAAEVSDQTRAERASFRCRALIQTFAPAPLVASVAEIDILNDHQDEVIQILVMPLEAVPPALVDALRLEPVAGPIPEWFADDDVHPRSLEHIRQGFVVKVNGYFTKAALRSFADHVELDGEAVRALLAVGSIGSR